MILPQGSDGHFLLDSIMNLSNEHNIRGLGLGELMLMGNLSRAV